MLCRWEKLQAANINIAYGFRQEELKMAYG